MSISQVAKFLRKEKTLTLREAAVKLEISHPHLCNIENNCVSPSLHLMNKMEEVYGVNLSVLDWSLQEDKTLPASIQKLQKELAKASLKMIGTNNYHY